MKTRPTTARTGLVRTGLTTLLAALAACGGGGDGDAPTATDATPRTAAPALATVEGCLVDRDFIPHEGGDSLPVTIEDGHAWMNSCLQHSLG